ncbi:MAG: Holliday junction branch migration protein RuvA [Parvularculales bacterium]
MIGKLRGLIDDAGDDWLIIDVGGVGYHVICSARTLRDLPKRGEVVSLAIETYVREDQLRLFGFIDEAERHWFRLLLNVQGVGVRVALALLGIMSPDELSTAIAVEDKPALVRAPGVGARVAQRITSELKDKALPVMDNKGVVAVGNNRSRIMREAVSALVHLGYSETQASSAIASAMGTLGATAETKQLIRQGLRDLSV